MRGSPSATDPALSPAAEEIAALYRRWSLVDARGSSSSYERLSLAVSADPTTLELLAGLDPVKRQPNLLFAVLRWLGIPIEDPAATLAAIHADPERVREGLASRRTQTNEPARCAPLLPVLAQLPGPLAVVEVGASAGLCLMFDTWSYHYVGEGVDHRIEPEGARMALECAVSGPAPLPERLPEIVWRAGLDLEPVDPADEEARRWLRCLVWPEHGDRAARLAAALDVAAEVAPRVEAGDLVEDLPRLLEEAPAEATLVVMHSSTLNYVEPAKRERFEATLARLGAHRVGAERAHVLPHLAGQLPSSAPTEGRVVVSLDGRALALAERYGEGLEWFG